VAGGIRVRLRPRRSYMREPPTFSSTAKEAFAYVVRVYPVCGPGLRRGVRDRGLGEESGLDGQRGRLGRIAAGLASTARDSHSRAGRGAQSFRAGCRCPEGNADSAKPRSGVG
jgi:hypothetical protein